VVSETRLTRRNRGTDKPLRTEQDVAAALESFVSENEEEMLSRAGSIEELSRWVHGELDIGIYIRA
jgi:hypothetical protein